MSEFKARVYLAGASRELARVMPMVERLESSGLVTLTHRWFDAVASCGVGRDHELTREQAAQHAENDLAGVRTAEIFWCLWPQNQSIGFAIEFGTAMALRIPTVVTGPTAHACIFSALATYRDSSDEHGLVETVRRAELIVRHQRALCEVA